MTTPASENWADDESSDEEDKPSRAEDAENDEESEDEESSSESGDDQIRPATNLVAREPIKAKEKPAALINLSKKERKELKAKELNDLDALLCEFGVETEKQTSMQEDEPNVVEIESKAETSPPDASKAKKKKKKASDKKGSASEATRAEETASNFEGLAKPKIKSLSKKAGPDAAISAAIADLKEAAEAKKKQKKKEKKTYDY